MSLPRNTMVKYIRNKLLDVHYDLAHNIKDYSPITSDELKETLYTILLWQKHIVPQILISGLLATDLRKYKRWFRGVESIFENEKTTVKEMAPLIGNQILYFLGILRDLDCLNRTDLVSFILNLEATTTGTIDCIRAATYLVDKTEFENSKKFSIACHFCLVQKIHALSKIIKLNEFEFCADDKLRLEMFWRLSLKQRNQEFNELIKMRYEVEESNDEHLMFWAIRNENEIAVTHFWDKLCENKTNIEKFVTYALKFNSSNIACFLLSNMSTEDEIKSLCVKYGYEILSKIGNDLRWIKYFQNAANYMLQFIDEMDFSNTFKIIILCWIKDESERDRYHTLFTKFVAKFELGNDIKFDFSSALILSIFLAVEDEELLKSLLLCEEEGDMCYILNKLCSELIYLNFKLFSSLVANMTGDEDIEEFKSSFFGTRRSEIFANLIKMKKLDILEELLIYLYVEEDEICKIKAEFPYADKGKLVGDMLKKDEPSFQSEGDIDQFLFWSLNGNMKEIANCGNVLFDINKEEYAYCKDKFGKFVKHLLDTKKFEQLELFLNWALSIKIHLPANTNFNYLKNCGKKYEAISFAVKN